MAGELLFSAAQDLSLPALELGVFKAIQTEGDLFKVLPFKTVEGDTYKYSRELTLPTVGPVGADGEFTDSIGTTISVTVEMKRYGGQSRFDDMTTDLTSALQDPRAVHTGLLVKAIARAVENDLIYGDASVEALRFSGLRKLVSAAPATQSFAATGSGGALTLADIDNAYRLLKVGRDQSFFTYNGTTDVSYRTLLRGAGGVGAYELTLDAFGGPVLGARGRPIVINDWITETEASNGDPTGGDRTSMYLIGGGPEGLMGLLPRNRQKAIRVTEIGPLEKKAGIIVRAEVALGLALHSGLSIVRIYGIKN